MATETKNYALLEEQSSSPKRGSVFMKYVVGLMIVGLVYVGLITSSASTGAVSLRPAPYTSTEYVAEDASTEDLAEWHQGRRRSMKSAMKSKKNRKGHASRRGETTRSDSRQCYRKCILPKHCWLAADPPACRKVCKDKCNFRR